LAGHEWREMLMCGDSRVGTGDPPVHRAQLGSFCPHHLSVLPSEVERPAFCRYHTPLWVPHVSRLLRDMGLDKPCKAFPVTLNEVRSSKGRSHAVEASLPPEAHPLPNTRPQTADAPTETPAAYSVPAPTRQSWDLFPSATRAAAAALPHAPGLTFHAPHRVRH